MFEKNKTDNVTLRPWQRKNESRPSQITLSQPKNRTRKSSAPLDPTLPTMSTLALKLWSLTKSFAKVGNQRYQRSLCLSLGGAGNKVLRVIEGDAHAYVFASPGTKKWDTCAPEAILVAMGGALTGKSPSFHPKKSPLTFRYARKRNAIR